MKRVLIGFDIGGTSARAALFELDADASSLTLSSTAPRDVLIEPLRLVRSPEALFAKMRAMLLSLVTRNDIKHLAHVHAVGVGLAAQLDTATSHVFNAPNLGWRALDLAPILRQSWAATEQDGGGAALDPGQLLDRVFFFNDLNAYVYGDVCAKRLNHPADYMDVLGVAAGTGVGAAIISSGRLLLGARGQAGELGHVKVESPVYGKLCGCGERGCLEAHVGGIHLEAEIARLIEELSPEWADEVSRGGGDGVAIDLAAADALCEEVDALSLVFERAAEHFASVVGAAITLLNPQVLLLGGGVWEHAPCWRGRVLEKLGAHVLAVAGEALRVESLGQAEHLSTLGAALLAMHRRAELIPPPDPC